MGKGVGERVHVSRLQTVVIFLHEKNKASSPGTVQCADARHWIRTCNPHPDDEIFILVASTTAREFGPIGIPSTKRNSEPRDTIERLTKSEMPNAKIHIPTRICAHVKLAVNSTE